MFVFFWYNYTPARPDLGFKADLTEKNADEKEHLLIQNEANASENGQKRTKNGSWVNPPLESFFSKMSHLRVCLQRNYFLKLAETLAAQLY